jgi:tRNA dimethylallyltransferase
MIENGLLEETQELFSKKLSHTASQAIAYKELFPFFKGEKTLEECVEFLKMQSRRYAKRQLTWFRHDEKVNWIEVDRCDDVFKKALEIIDKSEIF